METVDHDGRTTAYREPDVGEGPTVLFVHGSGATHRVWAAQYGRQSPPYQPVALDLSGHGESDDVETDSGPATLRAYANDVAAVARVTDADVLVGNSLGGAVLQTLLLDGGYQPAGLVLQGTGAKLTVHGDLRAWLAEDFERAVEFLHGEDMLFHDPQRDMADESRAAMRAVGRAITERDFLACHTFDVRDRIGQIDVPTLALVGEYDSLTPVTYHEFFADEMPDCRLAVVPRAAHLAMVERPAAVNESLDEFVTSL